MIYEQFDNLIEINIKDIPNKFIRFKIYENILHFFKLYKCNILIITTTCIYAALCKYIMSYIHT